MAQLAIDPNDPGLGGNVVGGDSRTFHPMLWDFLVERFDVHSVLDVGCGEGHCVQYFLDQGLEASGFDGLEQNVVRAVVPIERHDLRFGPFVRPVDLVHCCEVVEHIEERFLEHLVRTLANGRVIAMTHAVPGQGGHHHVNCQPASYWIEQVEVAGYRYLPDVSEKGRALITSEGHWTYFVATGLIFARA